MEARCSCADDFALLPHVLPRLKYRGSLLLSCPFFSGIELSPREWMSADTHNSLCIKLGVDVDCMEFFLERVDDWADMSIRI